MEGKKKGFFDRMKEAPPDKALRWTVLAIAGLVVAVMLISSFMDNDPPGELSMSTEERVAEAVAMIDGVEEASVVMTYDGEEIVGAVVVARGVEDVGVKLDVMRAVRTLLDVEAERIEIFEKKR